MFSFQARRGAEDWGWHRGHVPANNMCRKFAVVLRATACIMWECECDEFVSEGMHDWEGE